MPYSTIKNLVLMVIILVIVVAILLRVPGLAEKIFGTIGAYFENIEEGKALHVRLDANNHWLDSFDLFEFHLTNLKNGQHISVFGRDYNKATFYLDTSSHLYLSNCVILTSLEGESKSTDHGFIYYVSPGSIIQKEYNGQEADNLGSFVNVVEKNCSVTYSFFNRKELGPYDCSCFCESDDCIRGVEGCPNDCFFGAFVENLECEHPFGFVVAHGTMDPGRCPPRSGKWRECDWNEWVFEKKFETARDTKDRCVSPKDCNLLVTEGDKHAYMVKYGLICDNDGIWQPCTKKKADSNAPVIEVGNNKFICCPSDDVFVWKPGDQC